jgi:excisionase family DNA binding protein
MIAAGSDTDHPSPWPRWLSLTKAAAYASMSKGTIMRYILDGEIYGTRKGGKWYVDRTAIDTFFLAGSAREDAIVRSVLGGGR